MSQEKNWSLTLTPHRSLSREGFIAIMVIVFAINLVGGIVFLVAGAWPIAGFMGLDVLLIWLAFRWNYADAARAERLVARDDQLTLFRHAPRLATTEVNFNRRWVNVDLEFDDERELVGRLFLRSHGRGHEIASFLGAEERRSLATELRRVI